MKVRHIQIDYTDSELHWTPDTPEFAQFWNASSTYLPYLEPFLNRTVRAGIEMLEDNEENAELINDCKIFIQQETRHFKNHARYNAKLRASGYPELAQREKKMQADYKGFAETRSHKFCLAYTEGFETLGLIVACYFLEGAKELESPSVCDPTLDLWRWHLAEEYEHRHVAFKLFHKLYGSYWYRLFGIVYAGPHMLNYMFKTAFYIISEDRKSGKIADPWKSRLRMLGVSFRMAKYIVPRLLKTFHPSYDPLNAAEPRESMKVLAQAEEKWGPALP
jgi:uncharacterized protein